MTYCILSCLISIVFLISMIYYTLLFDKNKVINNYKSKLNENQLIKYNKIVNERKEIYFKGYILGFILSFVYIIFIKKYINNLMGLYKNLGSKPYILCTVTAITFITNYFFYILSPKSDWMILHIDDKELKQEWLKVYRTMQKNYHLGFVFGILAVVFFTNFYC